MPGQRIVSTIKGSCQRHLIDLIYLTWIGQHCKRRLHQTYYRRDAITGLSVIITQHAQHLYGRRIQINFLQGFSQRRGHWRCIQRVCPATGKTNMTGKSDLRMPPRHQQG